MALTANRANKVRALEQARYGYGTVATGSVIFQGALLSKVETSGLITLASSATGETFIGVALDAGTGVAAGTVKIAYRYNHEEKFTPKTALTKSYIGCAVVAFDDEKPTTASAISAAKRAFVGVATDFESDGSVWVWIRQDSQKLTP